MTAENTVQWMMDFYPDDYPTRKHCLNYLFCVVGNGMVWENGQLIDKGDPKTSRYQMVVSIKRAKSDNEETWLVNHQLELLKQIADPEYQPDAAYMFNWYPLSKEYSKLYNYPEDIRPDWLAAIEECKRLLAADGVTA